MITKIIQEEKIQKAKKYVEKGESFVIVTHVSPDGDALGSSLGLYHFLSAYGKDNVAVVVPNAFPSFYRWMPGAKDVVIHEKYPDTTSSHDKNLRGSDDDRSSPCGLLRRSPPEPVSRYVWVH